MPPIWDLGVTYTLYLEPVEKPVVEFLIIKVY